MIFLTSEFLKLAATFHEIQTQGRKENSNYIKTRLSEFLFRSENLELLKCVLNIYFEN